MHKARAILNAFHAKIYELKSNSSIANVVKTNVDTEQAFPLISVTLGQDSKEEFTAQLYQHELTLFTDIYVNGSSKDLDDQMLDIRELIELKVLSMGNLSLDYIFRIEFQSQSEPNYNSEGLDYASSTRLEWLIEYHSEHENPSN